ncbi:MAG TPA: hypothetical protein VH331_06655 [Allosphingosinicella sp.]|nr:hypothetical protein [Allosphingosinicella sp.]
MSVGTCVVADKYHHGRITGFVDGGYTVKGFGPNDTPMVWPYNDVVVGPCADQANRTQAASGARPGMTPQVPGAGGGVCFASDRVAGGGLDGQVRAVLVRAFSHEPQPGEDGRITVHINSLRVGAARRATEVDSVQYQTVAGRTIYDVRANFDTCTDYNRRLVYVRRDRNFACFIRASGGFDCSMTASSANLAPDQRREVPK